MSVSLTVDDVERIVSEGVYNLIPVFVTLNADLETPVSAFIKVQ